MRILATILALALLAGAAGAINYDIVRQVSNDGPTNFVGTDYLPTNDNDPNWSGWTPLQVGDTITKTDDFGNVVNVPVGPKVVEQPRSTVNSFLGKEVNRLVPKYEYPHAVNPSTPTVSPVASNGAPKLSDIQGDIPIALKMAGVTFDGSKADQNRYDSAVATDYLGNPVMVADGFALPYTMSKDAVPYQSVFAPSKQSQYALTHGKAVYNNPDGTTTSIPLLAVASQPAFHIWYKSTYSDPFIVLPTMG